MKKHEEAYRFFQFATRMDLDNYNRNSDEGLHTTSIAAAWMNIVYGFGGLRSDGEQLSICPTMPRQWKGYSFRINYQERMIKVEIAEDKVFLSCLKGDEFEIKVYGIPVRVGKEQTEVTIPGVWRA